MTDGRGTGKNVAWDDDMVAIIQRQWPRGRSAAQIAVEINADRRLRGLTGGVTRLAVIGKVGRLGLANSGRAPASQPPTISSPVKVRSDASMAVDAALRRDWPDDVAVSQILANLQAEHPGLDFPPAAHLAVRASRLGLKRTNPDAQRGQRANKKAAVAPAPVKKAPATPPPKPAGSALALLPIRRAPTPIAEPAQVNGGVSLEDLRDNGCRLIVGHFLGEARYCGQTCDRGRRCRFESWCCEHRVGLSQPVKLRADGPPLSSGRHGRWTGQHV